MGEADGSSARDARTPGPVSPPDDAVAALEVRLGIPLPDRATALAALTHKSYVNEHRDEAGLADNERLEFLGDAIVDLAVSHRLMERFPDAREGDLSKMRAAVVDEQGLSEMARALGLGALLRLGRGEELTGGRQKASLLADAMEAVVAAVYGCGGLPAVLGLIDRFLGDAFARASAGTLDRDFKTQLQELTQSRIRATPRYRVVAEHGPDHSKVFEVEMDLRGEVMGRGAGRSKKDAEQAAAKTALDVLGRRLAAEAAAAAAPARGPAAEHRTLAPEAPPSVAVGDPAGPPPSDGVAARAEPAAPEPARAEEEPIPPTPAAAPAKPRPTRKAPAERRKTAAAKRPRAAAKRVRAGSSVARPGTRRKRDR
jgi:ribonuclease-3